MLTSTSSLLNLAPNQTIVGAYLIWAGISNGANTTLTINGTTFTPDFINVTDPFPTAIFPAPYFSAVKDITSFVQTIGNGNYQVTNFNLNPYQGNYYINGIYFAGWNIIVVYSNPTLPNKQLNLYDGYRFTSNGSGVPLINFPVNNLNVTNTSGAKMTMISFNGNSTVILGQTLKVNNSTLSNVLNPANNPFNSTNSFTNSTSSWQMDVDTYSINNYINVGDVSFVITAGAALPTFFSTIITSIQSELPDATISLDSITGQDICQNRDLTLDYTVYNVNSNDTLLAGTPVSVFVNDSILISTVLLPSNILMGDSLSLSTLVTIPTGITSPFSLSMVVNQNSTQLGVYPESNFGNNTSNDSTITLTETIYPDFGFTGPFCQGTNFALAPLSLNNVDGNWTPATFNNQNTGTYYFLPNDTTCNQPLQLTIEIVPLITPSFSIPPTICQNGSVTFPNATANGIHGTWAPPFNNQATTTYTFTPDAFTPAAGCPTPVQYTVNVEASVPLFSLPDSVCQNAQLSFPLVSDNGIYGSWTPAFDTQNSATYTFTPDLSNPNNQIFSCPVSAQHAIEIVVPIQPAFSFASSLCAGSSFNLPTLSDNGISGTWSAPFNNQVSTNYTFTPDTTSILNSCSPSINQNIAIIPTLTPSFSFADSLCEGAVFYFPDVSSEGITGIWTPLFNNQQTQNYTFTPSSLGIVNTTLGLRCPLVLNQSLIIIANPVAAFTAQNNNLPLIDPSTSFSNTSTNAYSWIWDFGDETSDTQHLSPTHSFPSQAGQYTVSLTVANQLGCADSSSLVISILHDPMVFVPNAFTPDNNEINNEFTPVFPDNMKLSTYSLEIYNRWGELIFTSNNPKQGWDGTYNYSMSPDCTYSYQLRFTEVGYSTLHRYSGNVVLVR
jgi:gliding motility-associated-like protein